MDLYLMQHGEALPESVDPDRALSDEGRASVSATAARAASGGLVVERVVHSGRVRALQSGAILAAALGCQRLEERAGLSPSDSVVAAAGWIDALAREGAVAIVGHLPFLDRLAGLLVAGDETVQVIAFRNGGLVRLVSDEGGEGAWRIAWALTPQLP